MSWQEWIQDVGKDVIGKWSEREYTQDYELNRLRLQALGEAGFYEEGQPGVARAAASAAKSLPVGWIVMGAVVLVGVVMLTQGKR